MHRPALAPVTSVLARSPAGRRARGHRRPHQRRVPPSARAPRSGSTPCSSRRRCADPLYRRSVRVSMGTVFQVPWTRIDPWPDGLACCARRASSPRRWRSRRLDHARRAGRRPAGQAGTVLGAEGRRAQAVDDRRLATSSSASRWPAGWTRSTSRPPRRWRSGRRGSAEPAAGRPRWSPAGRPARPGRGGCRRASPRGRACRRSSDVPLHGLLAEEQVGRDRRVRPPLGHERRGRRARARVIPASGRAIAGRARRRETMVGSITHSPSATRCRASMRTATSTRDP